MARRIHRTVIAGVSALAIAITALGASRAQASDLKTEPALAAILGLVVVGALIASQRDADRTPKVVTRDGPDHGIAPRPLPRRAQRKFLPADCLRVVQVGRGREERVFGGRCLRQSYAFADSLPRRCAQSLGQRHGGRPTVWNARCLRHHGYRSSRR